MDARVRRFALLGVALLALALTLYPFVLPAYSTLVMDSSGFLLSRLSPPIWLDPQGAGAWMVSTPPSKSDAGLKFTMDFSEFGPEVAFLGLAILPALVLATPASMPARLRLLVISLAFLFAFHTLTVSGVLLILVKYCHGMENARTMCRLIAESLTTCGHIAVFGLWGALTWRHWFAAPARPAAPEGRRRRR